MKKNIYLDANSTVITDPRVWDVMTDITYKSFGNPHSVEHSLGWAAEEVVQSAQTVVGDYISAFPEEIIFTSGATESNNLAIIGCGLSEYLGKNQRKKIIISTIEHKCVLEAASFLEKNFGFEVVKIPVSKQGFIDLEQLAENLDAKTLLVSVMSTNNEIGLNQPIEEIGQMCREVGVVFHVDAAQSSYRGIDVVSSNIDFLSLSAHKMYGPKGIGCLYINSDSMIKPMPILHGGGQQLGYRSGTLAPPLIAGMAKAVEIIKQERNSESKELSNLRTLFLSELKKHDINYSINGDIQKRHPGNINLCFHGIDARSLVLRLQPKISLSTGSACSSGVIEPSYVLREIGLSKQSSESSVRICFNRFNTEDEAIEGAYLISLEIEKMLA